MDSDPLAPLDAAALRDGLVGPGMPWRQLDVVAETGSTNADLLARAEAGADIDGSVLLAEYQNAGRGRHGRQWTAPSGTQIALSVGVSGASVPHPGWGWLTLATGVAVADALADAGVEAGLKWPNDVLVGGGKLAGILAEVASPAQVIVVGLGLNVALTADQAPDPVATSRTGEPHRCLAHRRRGRLGAARRLPALQPDPEFAGASQHARRPRGGRRRTIRRRDRSPVRRYRCADRGDICRRHHAPASQRLKCQRGLPRQRVGR
jgi:BirA family transcriptional regulator, biotin operon repressor / biotin---[acetyl-CoA-carboxylase] ligase